MRRDIQWIIIMLITIFLVGCKATPWLEKNVSLEKVSANAPAKDRVIVAVTVLNDNSIQGKVIVGVEVNCGTVTWREKRQTLKISPHTQLTATFEFRGIQDRIPTMAKIFKYQARIYNSQGRVLEESGQYTATKPYGRPD
jgi:hypothetical protein